MADFRFLVVLAIGSGYIGLVAMSLPKAVDRNRLDAFLHEIVGRPFVYGEWDCQLWLAEWVRRTTGHDPGAAWRGGYTTAWGAARIVKERGGLVFHMEAALLPCGYLPIGKPTDADFTARWRDRPIERGDIAALICPEGELGALVLSPEIFVILAVTGRLLVRPLGMAGRLGPRVELLRAWGR
jgi:hypothetical protein